MYLKKLWKDRVSEHPTRRVLTPVDGSPSMVVDVARSEGAIGHAGDMLNAQNLNELEDRVANAFGKASAVKVYALTNPNPARFTGYSLIATIAPSVGLLQIEGGISFAETSRENAITQNTVFADLTEINEYAAPGTAWFHRMPGYAYNSVDRKGTSVPLLVNFTTDGRLTKRSGSLINGENTIALHITILSPETAATYSRME